MSITDWRGLHGDRFEGITTMVTGGAGFIGSHLTEALLALGARVRVLDDLSGGDRANLQPLATRYGDRLEFHENSILDQPLLADLMRGCRYVFHQAALGSVPGSIEQPRHYSEVNITGTINVLEAARAAEAERGMFAASAAAYGESEQLPKIETMPTDCRSPYAATKVAGEALMAAWAAGYPLDTAALRYFNIFGPRQNANSAYAAVIAAFAAALIEREQAPVIFGDGEQSRDFTYVDNVVHANLLAAASPRRLGGAVINIACGQRISVNTLAAKMAATLDRPHLKPTHQPDRPGDVRHSQADLGRARQLLDYEPIVGFDEGLAPTLGWYQSVMV